VREDGFDFNLLALRAAWFLAYVRKYSLYTLEQIKRLGRRLIWALLLLGWWSKSRDCGSWKARLRAYLDKTLLLLGLGGGGDFTDGLMIFDVLQIGLHLLCGELVYRDEINF